jgi:hypothetical protein
MDATLELAMNKKVSTNLRRAVQRRLKDKGSWMSGYLSQGWPALFDDSWKTNAIAGGQITAQEIDELVDVSRSRQSTCEMLIDSA